MTFSKILIANRGEIACRIIRTARRMGIATVAVYSDADARAPFVRLADEAVPIGPAPAAQSYLVPEKIIAACRQTGAEAVHPGYGFLSERASFVEALEAEGIAFIGPPAGAIAAMGDKIASKRIAREAGVNIVPGFVGEIESTDHAVSIAREIGYPVMLKASAGGGGKGMRLAWSDDEVHEGFPATQREALSSFGDDRVFIEKFIESPRHIEIQLLGDKHGNLVYLHERECSIQRRHQKVVEEAPSPFVSPEMRRRMGEQAVSLARSVGYHSAGTVELIVSGADTTGESFYFLEMNTRLQVEHPVTEAVTGIDLVEQMIRVAAGEALSFTQDDIALDGWSIESRIYAEDPYRGFLPSVGRLVRYTPPPAAAHQQPLPAPAATAQAYVRLDDGVAEGGEVSIHYDPMIAKLITWAPTRQEAADLQVRALDDFEIVGPANNIDFLSALVQHPRFRAGALTTGFIAEEYPDGFHGAPADEERLHIIAAVAARCEFTRRVRAGQISGRIDGPPAVSAEWVVRLGGQEFAVALADDHAMVNGRRVNGSLDWQPGKRIARLSGNGLPLSLTISRKGVEWRIATHGTRHVASVLPAAVAPYHDHMIEKVPPDLSRLLRSPMPGLLVALHVREGDKVEPGQRLATIEAMKMENILRAERASVVAIIHATEGDSLAADAVILELD